MDPIWHLRRPANIQLRLSYTHRSYLSSLPTTLPSQQLRLKKGNCTLTLESIPEYLCSVWCALCLSPYFLISNNTLHTEHYTLHTTHYTLHTAHYLPHTASAFKN